MNSPRISMITICRNAEATIAHTINSVKHQQIPGLEYIIIDAASTDSTVDIVRSFGTLINTAVSEPDDGIADAFNKGLARASGDVIGFINADDQLLPETLDFVLQHFNECAELDVLHGDVLLYDKDQFVKKLTPAGRWWYPWRLVLFNHPATFVRRRVYDRYGIFDLSYRYAMDDELFLRWVFRGAKIHYVAKPLVRMQAGGASGIHAKQVFVEKRRALRAYGYPRLLVELQFFCRFVVQIIAIIQSVVRKMGRSRVMTG